MGTTHTHTHTHTHAPPGAGHAFRSRWVQGVRDVAPAVKPQNQLGKQSWLAGPNSSGPPSKARLTSTLSGFPKESRRGSRALRAPTGEQSQGRAALGAEFLAMLATPHRGRWTQDLQALATALSVARTQDRVGAPRLLLQGRLRDEGETFQLWCPQTGTPKGEVLGI